MSGSCACSRRTRMPTTSQGTDGSRSSTTSRSRSTPPPRRSIRSRPARRRRRDRGRRRRRCAASTRPATAPSTAASRSSTARAPTSRGCCSRAIPSSSATRLAPTSPSRRARGSRGDLPLAAAPARAARRRRGLSGPRRRIALRPRDELEGVDDDRLRAHASTRRSQISELDAFVAESASDRERRKPPNVARIVGLNRGPLLGAPAEPAEHAVPPDGAQLLDVRPVDAFLAGHRHGAISVPVSGPSFATKAGFLLDPERPSASLPPTRPKRKRAIRGLRSVGFLDIPGYVLGGGPEQIEPVSVDDLEKLLDEGADVIDVREKDERDDGYIPGTQNIPYRLVARAGRRRADRPAGRHRLRIGRARRRRRQRARGARHRRTARGRRRRRHLARAAAPAHPLPPLRLLGRGPYGPAEPGPYEAAGSSRSASTISAVAPTLR